MPELPDITVYNDALRQRIGNAKLEGFELRSPFLLRSVSPAPNELLELQIGELRRVGKRIAIGFEERYWIVIHLMIAGRLQWHEKPPGRGGKNVLADLQFSTGVLRLTEAGTRKRASMHVVGHERLADLDPGGLEVLDADTEAFVDALTRKNHTLKRALTDPHILSGIGNAYSDEILHFARHSPLAQTRHLPRIDLENLHSACVQVLEAWIARLRALYGGKFPTRVTAFRAGMAVHGRFGKPCPVCGTAVQRIRYARNETNYCPRCQTGGRIYADRALSRLLRDDWPRTIEELEGG